MGDDRYSVRIDGDVSGQVGVGHDVEQHQQVITRTETASAAEDPVRILFLAANPKDTSPLRLGEEVRTIAERLREADYRDRLQLEQDWAVRVGDLSRALLEHRPHVVHFSGHGSPAAAIILEDADGRSSEVPPGALGDLFGILDDGVRCVVLNACYSATQAGAMIGNIDCLIGTTRKISDPAAIRFAGGFYRGIGFGKSIATAFALGQNEIDLAALGEADTPMLSTREGVDAAAIHLVDARAEP